MKPSYRWAATGGRVAAGRDAVELAAIGGLPKLDGWQQQVVRDWLRTDAGGQWLHGRALLLVPRQNGKSVLAVVRALAGLFLFGETLLVSAHRAKTSVLLFRAVADAIESSPELKARTRQINRAHGTEQIITRQGNTAYFGSRVSSLTSSVRGSSIDCLIADEALVLGEEWLSSALPAMSARANPQVLLLSSAGDVSSLVLAGWRAAAYAQTPGLVAHEWAADEHLPHDDPATWRVANPAYPARISRAAIETEMATLSAHSFARERLGRWSEQTTEPAIPPDLFEAACRLSVGTPDPGRAVLAADVSIDPRSGRRYGALACAWPTATGTDVVLVASGPDTDWLPGKAAQTATAHNIGQVHMCVGSAVDVAAGVAAGGLPVRKVPYPELKGAAARLVELLAHGQVRIQESDALATAARYVPRKASAEGWSFGRPQQGSAAPLSAVALAVALSVSVPVEPPSIW